MHINACKPFLVTSVHRVALEDDTLEATMRLKGNILTADGEARLMALLDEWDSLLRDDPGCTDVLQLDIDMGDAPPFRSTPYQVPAKWRDAVKAELEQLKKQGILVPSVSG